MPPLSARELPSSTKPPAGALMVIPLKSVPAVNVLVLESLEVPVKIRDSPQDGGVFQFAGVVHLESPPAPGHVDVAAADLLPEIKYASSNRPAKIKGVAIG